ncbi:HD domain-containing protein [Deinococcus wulumuqiensis]|uniref:tRNA nucleotidyltransferase n=1 Tax=Deinococcus wulumuqiensis TaxID=980427 RepID=A0AAV4K6P7_9DEIO|nr:HD domain-containing protein [Deinococcus wulumuqiensis]QII20386.1 CCA tRNA nucleotidyltransferase [Deinococcus wulumuqiensis R12]GGI82217.1 tRNA nucleotidyltransferase [Deinococcus wulumuqiensis]GGP29431.1 tRNA nucleotidyltransferase [Deinococcus wulumuqiensis]
MFRRRPPLPPFPPGAVLVGGAARDWLRGVTPRDYDWALPDPEAGARAQAAQVGGSAFALDEARGYWRVTAGDVQHDFVPLPASLEDDLRRRDFTVNALAIREGGRVLDLLGGQGDLKRRVLRMVSEDNLRADPLRAWRAARFVTTLGFTLERQTERAVRQVASDLKAGHLPFPAWERIRDEVHALLQSPEAARGLLTLDDLGLLALTLPELPEGRGVEQGGFHHLDVFHHNLEALHQLLGRRPDADLPLRWAALLHDVGKPRTLALDPETGRRSFHGHDRVGADLSTQMLTRLKLPGEEVKRAAALVKAHMVQLPANETEARRFVHRRRDLLPDLLSLMLADREAARGPSSTPGSRHAYALAMERVLAALEEQPAAPAPLLGGEDVMALLGLLPGPRVGEVLRALAEARALGEVGSVEEARAFVRAWPGGRRAAETGS